MGHCAQRLLTLYLLVVMETAIYSFILIQYVSSACVIIVCKTLSNYILRLVSIFLLFHVDLLSTSACFMLQLYELNPVDILQFEKYIVVPSRVFDILKAFLIMLGKGTAETEVGRKIIPLFNHLHIC